MRKVWLILLLLLLLLNVRIASAETFDFHMPATTGLEKLPFTLDVKTSRKFHLEVKQGSTNGAEAKVLFKQDYERQFASTFVNVEVPLGLGMNTITATDLTPAGTRLDPSSQDVVRFGDAVFIDERGTFESTFHSGLAIDTFAASEQRRYLNSENSDGLQERAIGGFDFAFRLLGGPSSPHPVQLWVYGETIHGTRSAEVNCQSESNRDKPICKLNFDAAAQRTFYLMRNATSLEGNGGFRLEFLPLQRGETSAANVYLKLQAGFLSVSKAGSDVVDAHHVALGAIATRGTLRNSFLKFGPGRTDLFGDKSKKRWKIDGYLEFPIRENSVVRPYVQMNVDADFGSGSDSVQTYVGINVDLEKFADLFK